MISQNEKPLILVAEDVESNYLLVSTILRNDYELVHAWNGVEAVELFKQNRPSIVLMDMKMPEMDGLEATRLIRQSDKDTPIVAVTAFAFDQDKQRTLEAGCNDYITKPIIIKQLRDTIKKWLARV
ncbi:MAG: response regulator [Bacteroidales bacterium]|nr:response regulator [Bacteroidales bacterium]